MITGTSPPPENERAAEHSPGGREVNSRFESQLHFTESTAVVNPVAIRKLLEGVTPADLVRRIRANNLLERAAGWMERKAGGVP